MVLPDKTILEMRAGAMAVAKAGGPSVDSDVLGMLERAQQRMAALRRWEREGTLRVVATATRLLHYVGAEVFEEEQVVLEWGGYPSELLVARIALAIQAMKAGGMKGGGNG